MAGHVLAKVTSKENNVDNVHIISSSFYGVCNSPANSANKEVIVANPNITNITLVKGMLLTVRFTFNNMVDNTSLTLFKNVGSEESPLKNNNDTPLVLSIGVLTHEGENNTKVLWTTGSIVSFIYNGTNWIAMSSSNTAKTDLSNVDNAWIQNGVIRNGVIGDAQIGGISANKLTAGTIDASNIHVTNLRADNLIVTRMNGQPVIGGYTVVNSDATGYEEMNPVERGWYEIQSNGTMVKSEDTEVDLNKVYYSSTSSVALYDQNYINNMETELNSRIDGAIETFSGKEIPTEHNKPYTDWYDTTVSPVKDDRKAHVGDLYYVIGAYDEVESTIPGYNNMSPIEQEWYEFDEINQTHILSEDTEVDENKTYYISSLRNGYCYRFYEDSTTNTFNWVLIKDSDVTAALSSISELQNFNEQLSHWEEATDEGVVSIRQKFTTLSGKVDNTITSAIQVWYTGTASPPSKPDQRITSTATTSGTWTTVIPDYNDDAAYYYYCWQYLRSDNTCTHSEVIYDKTTTENQQIARDAAATANGAISGVDVEYISITSNTTPPSQEDLNWHSTITAGDYGDGLYIWQRTKTTTRTSISYTQPVCISGRDGQGAYIYSLTCNPSVIVKDNNGNFSPTAVAFSATRAQGTNTPVAYEGRFIIQESEDGSNWTTVSNISDQTNTTSVVYNTPTSSSNIKLLKGTLYMGGTAAVTPVDTQTVPIVTDGQNGQEGHDAYTVLLTNESHTFAANTSNALTASVTSEVIAYKGATRVTASIGTIANTTTGVTAAIVNNTNNTISPQFSVSVGSAVTAPQGIITIPVQVDGHNFEKQFAWALAFKGSEGKGIKSVTEYYALNNSTTAPTGNHSTSPSVWSTAIKTPTKDNKYVWNYEVITYTDNTTATPTTKHIAATYGETGAAGKSISNIVDYYQTTTNTTAPSSIYESTTTPNGWSITVQNPTSTNKYLWNYEQISYTDGSTPTTTDPRIIGVYGDSGISATKIEEEYIKTNSSTNPPGDNEAGWSTTQPTWEPNYYIWTRSKITWSAPNPSITTVTTPVLARGLNSANETAADAQAKANSALKSNIQLWTVNGGNGNTLNPGPSTPSAPTAVVTTTATTVTANSWTLAVPTYTPSLSYYYYCLQQERGDGQYQWTTPIYDPTTSDMMKTTSEIITFEQTTNKTITDTVSEQSTQITQLTNETKTIANPNLSPFFSHDFNDIYNSSTNPKGYWRTSLIDQYLTQLEDGWAHYEYDNTNGSSQKDLYIRPARVNTIDTSKEYTFLVEIRNNNPSGTSTHDIYLQQISDNQFWGNIIGADTPSGSKTTTTMINFLTCGQNYVQYCIRMPDTEHITSDSGWLGTWRVRTAAGATNNFDIRMSLYEGVYQGPYKPYIDQIGLTTLTNTVNEVKQTATANSSIISELVTTLGVNTDGTNPDLENGSFLHRVSEAEQTLDGFTSRVGRIEQNIAGWYAISSTAKDTTAKTATISPAVSNWTLSTGTTITVKFNNENTVTSPTLNINSTGAKTIKNYTKEALTEDEYKWPAGTIYTFVYDGTYWVMTNDSSRIKQAESKITQNANNIELKVSESDVTGNYLVGKINLSSTTATISADKVEINGTAIFNSISPSINNTIESKGYITTTAANNVINEAVNNLEIGGRNLLYDTSNWSKWAKTSKAIESDGILTCTNTDTSAFQRANGWFVLDKTDLLNREIIVSFDVMKTDSTDLSTLCFQVFTTSAAPKSVASGNIAEGTRFFTSLSSTPTNAIIENANLINASTWTRVSVKFIPAAVLDGNYTDMEYLAVYVGIRNVVGSAQFRRIKGEFGNKATDWSPAPEDVEASISSIEQGLGGFDILWNRTNFANDTNAGGECYLCAYDPTTATRTDENGWAMWNGIKRTITKGMFNPNTVLPYNIPIYIVCRLSSSTATTGTNYMVWYNSGWKSGPMAPTASTITDWTWAEATDMVLGKFVEPGSEAAFTECETYRQPLKWGTITTDTITARSANAAAAAAQTTANNAAPKASAVKRTQRIYYRTSNSMTSWTMPTAWLTTAGDVFNQWTCKVPRMTENADSTGTKYLYLYTCEQREMANGTLEYTTVLLDDSTTVIDGGNIITGSITANKIAANSITADKINATDLHVNAANIDGTISFGQLPDTVASASDIPTSLGQLENDEGYQTSSDVNTIIENKGYATTTNLNTEIAQRKAQYGTSETTAGTQIKVVTCSNFELVAGNELTVKFTNANTYTTNSVQLNVNGKGAKNIWVANEITSNSNQLLWTANSYITFRYDGTQFITIGEPRTWYGTCSTAANTKAKTSAIAGCVICKGAKIELAMTNDNTYEKNTSNNPDPPTLNISSSGAKNIYFGTGTTIPTKANGTSWLAGNTATFTFDGQYWRTVGKTYIDANSITTGKIKADYIDVDDLNISNSLTLGAFTVNAKDLILNGVNLLRISELLTSEDGRPDSIDPVNGWIADSTPTSDNRSWGYANANWQIYLMPGDYILSWEVNKITTNSSRGLVIYPDSGNAIWTATGSNGPFNTEGIGSKTFSLTEETSIGIMFKLYDSIVRFKLEKGTIATNWSLSQEDENVNLSSQFDETKTLIQDNVKNIENVNKILQGYEDSETHETIEGLITTVDGKLDAGYLKSWLYADENSLALGKIDSTTNETIVKAVLNSEALTFEKQGTPVAIYGGEEGMSSPRAVVEDEFRIGNFMWVNKRSNGHTSFKYVGGAT